MVLWIMLGLCLCVRSSEVLFGVRMVEDESRQKENAMDVVEEKVWVWGGQAK